MAAYNGGQSIRWLEIRLSPSFQWKHPPQALDPPQAPQWCAAARARRRPRRRPRRLGVQQLVLAVVLAALVCSSSCSSLSPPWCACPRRRGVLVLAVAVAVAAVVCSSSSSTPWCAAVRPRRRGVLSYEADATTLPSGEKATDVTQFEWPSSVSRAAPVAASQSLTVLSYEADATTLPSGEKATDVTEFEWPSSLVYQLRRCRSRAQDNT